MRHKPYGPYEKCIKRPLDCILATGAFIVLSPVMGVTSILVKKKLGTPVLFKQNRPGKDEKIFRLMKFRTMTNERDENGELLPDEDRLTKFGSFLRSTSLDELPELLNIIKGDMALIGPRPLMVQYLPLYNEEQRHRHDVRPGMSGLAQVSGRNAISWEERFQLDNEYVKHISFAMDLSIMLKTIRVILSREGISSETSETMEDFKGTES